MYYHLAVKTSYSHDFSYDYVGSLPLTNYILVQALCEHNSIAINWVSMKHNPSYLDDA